MFPTLSSSSSSHDPFKPTVTANNWPYLSIDDRYPSNVNFPTVQVIVWDIMTEVRILYTGNNII